MKRATVKSPNVWHRGITMHRMEIGDGVAGVTFTIGSLAIFLIALPSLVYFVAFTVLLGVAVAGLLSYFHEQARPMMDGLSISHPAGTPLKN